LTPGADGEDRDRRLLLGLRTDVETAGAADALNRLKLVGGTVGGGFGGKVDTASDTICTLL
jgi:hypothetical protein